MSRRTALGTHSTLPSRIQSSFPNPLIYALEAARELGTPLHPYQKDTLSRLGEWGRQTEMICSTSHKAWAQAKGP